MVSERTAKFERLRAFTTFEDVFALALAESTKTHFTANSHKWCEAIYEVCKSFPSQIPELQSIYFSQRPPLPPQTDQVYQLFTTLALAGEISLPNPQLKRIVVEQSHKERMRAAIGDSLSKYNTFISQITGILEKNLALD